MFTSDVNVKGLSLLSSKRICQRLWLDLVLLLFLVWLPECGHLYPVSGISVLVSKSSVERHLPLLLFLCRALDPALSPALTVRTCLFPSAKELFTRSREQRETSAWSIALDFQLISYAKGETLVSAVVYRVHVQPQMDGALVFLHSSTWDLINGDGYYPFVSLTGRKEGSLTRIPIILGVIYSLCECACWLFTYL